MQHSMALIMSGVEMLSYIGLCRSCKLGKGQKFENLALVNSDGIVWFCKGFCRVRHFEGVAFVGF